MKVLLRCSITSKNSVSGVSGPEYPDGTPHGTPSPSRKNGVLYPLYPHTCEGLSCRKLATEIVPDAGTADTTDTKKPGMSLIRARLDA